VLKKQKLSLDVFANSPPPVIFGDTLPAPFSFGSKTKNDLIQYDQLFCSPWSRLAASEIETKIAKKSET
jgi:hypothetical protein